MAFRPHIEGLRALAVLPILLFHLDTAWCPGGFIGVDVFFVISGYLITGLILAQGDGFDFLKFYKRRFFRLFPALLATIVGTLVAGWFVLSPAAYMQAASSALAAALAVANVHFLATIDYFDAAGAAHPLLHTWSLGVEEQFYLVWPAVLVLAARRRIPVLATIGAVVLLSIAAVVIAQPYIPEAVFYLMPFRMFELGLGAGLVVVEPWLRQLPVVVRMAGGTLGLALVVGSAMLLDGSTPWPGPAMFPSLIGTALLIVYGSEGLSRTLLEHALPRFIGRTSYSVYLVHWPLISLYRTYIVVEPSRMELVFLGAGSILLGAALYVLVEVPFRMSGKSGRQDPGPLAATELFSGRMREPLRTGLAGALSLAVLSGSVAIIAWEGFASRLDKSRVQKLDKGLTFAGDICSTRRSRCAFGDTSAQRVLYLVGDSLALNWVHGLDIALRHAHVRGIALYDHGCLFAHGTRYFRNGIPDRNCSRNVAEAYDQLAQNRAPLVLAGSWIGYLNAIGPADAAAPLRQDEAGYLAYLEQRLAAGLAYIGATERPVVIVKEPYTTGVDLAKCLHQPVTGIGVGTARCNARSRTDALAATANVDRMLERLALRFPTITLVDTKTVFCPQEQCIVEGEEGLYFRDAMHLTNAGSRFLVEGLKQPLLAALFGSRS